MLVVVAVLMLPILKQIDIHYKDLQLGRTDGSLWCWGDNSGGQLGPSAGNDGRRKVPVLVVDVDDVAQIAGGDRHTCHAAIPMSPYSADHTGPKTQAGGAHEGLLSCA